ncbi:MAG: dTDP-4-dehydrorhamnose 3,5-epimerase family protein [Dehalococcoidia bacterium]|nr:dTDP-4-dehydrorhamnose 3,5-epimerase family protein [Dehalococcoidia bacterium]
MIHGVVIKQLKVNADERGYLMEILREDDEIFERFGQVYVALNYPGVVRAWHYHKLQNDFFIVVKGMVKVALYDAREDSPTHRAIQEVFMGERNNVLLRIPVGVLHGYKTTGSEPSLLLNFPTKTYDSTHPDEYRLPWNTVEIPYDWSLKNF